MKFAIETTESEREDQERTLRTRLRVDKHNDLVLEVFAPANVVPWRAVAWITAAGEVKRGRHNAKSADLVLGREHG